MKALCVTGFVDRPFAAKHLSQTDCRALGDGLKLALGDRLHAFDHGVTLADCWAYSLLLNNPDLLPSCANPPADRFATLADMVRSNIVLLQRYLWMAAAAEARPDVDVLAWVEYTVLKQRRVTPDVLAAFSESLERTPCSAVTLPGCWTKGPINDSEAHWRFVGSCWVCPASLARAVYRAVRDVVTLRTEMTGRLSWDMNSMAYVELLDVMPIRWYRANHDETQFTNYGRWQ
jgi:hypothetical protein